MSKHFVFLQGMPSSFFSRTAKALVLRGCRVTGINFCIGDRLFWRGPETVNYRGRFTNWPAYISDFIIRENVTDIVMLGDCRHYHKEAIAVAKEKGIRVTVLDFGYLRPGWLTAELDGKGQNSKFPSTPQDILSLGENAHPVNMNGYVYEDFWKMARGDLLYSFSNLLLWWLYPFYCRSDKRAHSLIYFPAMGLRLFRAKRSENRDKILLDALVRKQAPYFVFPLQLAHDFQITAYSPFASLKEAIQVVIASFALFAPKAARLVIKAHPWDPYLSNWNRIIRHHAIAHGIDERVDYFDYGNLDKMISHSIGMITVNSSAGIRALQLGCPVKTLGSAIYDITGLTYQGTLDAYWNNPMQPESRLVQAFVKALLLTIQIQGSFFTEPGLSDSTQVLADRLFDETIGQSQYKGS